MPQLWTEEPRLVVTYDVECAGRVDHDFYLALAAQLGATDVVDIGCGTGVFCTDLATRGFRATGVDPATAMVEAARRRPGAERVTWIHGTAADVPPASADLVVMSGHVAQYFVTDEEWTATLAQCRTMLRPGGHLAFESRDPRAREWERWTPDDTRRTYPHPDGGTFESWVEVVDVSGPGDAPIETHQGHTVLPSGEHLVSTETLRFRSATEIVGTLAGAGLDLVEMWGDWRRSPVSDATGELIVVARRPASQSPG
jgi:SAM-dependent methyltransferase